MVPPPKRAIRSGMDQPPAPGLDDARTPVPAIAPHPTVFERRMCPPALAPLCTEDYGSRPLLDVSRREERR